MPVTVVVGGQFGSEGKGKVAYCFAKMHRAAFAVRCGGPNSGHTAVSESGVRCVFRQIPTAALLPDVGLIVAAGSYIDVDVLLEEIETYGIGPERLFISPRAVIITDGMKREERDLVTQISSTGSGTGAAVTARISRKRGDIFAGQDARLARYTQCDVDMLLRAALDKGERVIIEGTQGYGLSLYHSTMYPKVTSRDTTAGGFISEVGVSPLDVDDVVMVIRAFPIRVAGDSGPLPDEINWETIRAEGGHDEYFEEYTTVTKKVRRVARFDGDVVRRAIMHNRPTKIVLNHVDYVVRDLNAEKEKIAAFVSGVEGVMGRPVDYIGVSPSDMASRAAFIGSRVGEYGI